MHQKGVYERFIKRPLDCALATGALVVLSPVLGVTAFAGRKPCKGNKAFRKLATK